MSRLLQHDRRKLAKFPSLVGVDEAGRGCLAGPVSAAAVWLDRSFFGDPRRARLANRANDSKKLSPAAREDLHDALCRWQGEGILRMAQATADILEIDAYNILGATRLAMSRCLQALSDTETRAGHPPPFVTTATASVSNTPANGECGAAALLFQSNHHSHPLVLVDGRPLRPFVWHHDALVGGDGRSLCIALASILAKVRRDHLMQEIDRQYPQYGLAIHKGYATPDHINAIRRHGPCPQHRPLFLRKILAPTPSPAEHQTEFGF
ncbi:MAG: ribonuclease HII [Puniceicoccales bacterium]|jgi:ribonuclease HII|nr:ribonuclease HII [Puniceicoccales bacterium]